MLQSAHHHDAFARTRMLRVLDQNVEGLFLGSMSPSRRPQSLRMASTIRPNCSLLDAVSTRRKHISNGLSI